MSFCKYILLLFFVLAAPNQSVAQYLSLFEAISAPSGLPSNYVFDADEDENGYLWVGTDRGLARYDGFTWKKWDTDNGLPGNYVNTIICNKRGGIYISIFRKGSFYFDIKNNSFKKISGSIRDQRGKVDNVGNLYLEDKNSRGSSPTLYYHPVSNPAKKVKAFDLIEKNPCEYHEFDPAQKLITHYRSFQADHQESGVFQTDGWRSRVIKVKFPAGFAKNIHHVKDEFISTIHDIYQVDSAGNLLLRHKMKDSIYNFLVVENQKLYIWNLSEGLVEIDKNGNHTHFNATNGLETNLVRNTFITSGGAVVACTLGGGLRVLFPPGRKKIALDQRPKCLASYAGKFYANYDDRIIAGTIDSAASFKTYRVTDKNIQSLYADADHLFTSTLTGITRFATNKSGWKDRRFYITETGSSATIPYHGGMLSGTYGVGILYYEANKVRGFTGYNGSLIVEKLFAIPGGFVATTYEEGVYIYDEKSNNTTNISLTEGLLSNSVYHVHEFKDTLWLSTKNGVSAIHKNKVVKNFPFSSGIVGNKVLYTLHDMKGCLWAVTDKYLHHQHSDRFFVIGSVPLIIENDDYVEAVTYDAQTNTIITGNQGGLLFTRLDRIITDYKVAQPILMEIVKNGSEPVYQESFSLEDGFSQISFLIKPPITNAMIRGNVYYRLVGQDKEYKLLNDSPRVVYENLRAGEYQFFAKTISPDGIESKPVELASFTVAGSFWTSFPFFMLLMLSVIGIAILASNYANKVRNRNYLQQLEIQKQVQQERERISKDLHDNLGASLVSFIAQSDYLEEKAKTNKWSSVQEKLAGLSHHARATLDLLRETIWATQEVEHTVADFVLRCRNYLHRFYEPTGITCNVSLNEAPVMHLSSNQTLNLFRCIQEISQNIVKHANAGSVNYEFTKAATVLDIKITDNGMGFDKEHLRSGNGLQNIALRIRDLEGNFDINSVPGDGTIIHIRIPV